MRTSKLVVLLVASVLAPALAGAETTKFRSPDDALRQGLSAYRGGYYEIAIPALEHAATENDLLADYYLAMIYSDNLGSRTDHVKAYRLFRNIVDEYAEIDPDLDVRAPIVGKSLTALAKYVRSGIAEIHLAPDAATAAEYLYNASVTFNDEDAQFELAKMQLEGEGVTQNLRLAKHWLSVLSQKGHPGAQAFLADLLWRGKYLKPDPVRALALIAVAVESAPAQERLWIEDIYQSIYCGTPKGIHKQATGIVADWDKRYGRKPDSSEHPGPAGANTGPVRTCQDGGYVGPLTDTKNEPEAPPLHREGERPAPPAPVAEDSSFAFGSTEGGYGAGNSGLRGVSAPDLKQ